MEPARLIEICSNPTTYPYPLDRVEVRQTHISAVFLAGPYVYKTKKPVDLGFLNFRTLEQRRHFCEEEVRLNRRLAADVYLGVVPLSQTPEGPRFEGTGDVLEWAVKMHRLPDSATLRQRLLREELDEKLLASVADRLARFHQAAERGPQISAYGRFEVVAQNARDNLAYAQTQVGRALSADVLTRLRERTEAQLTQLRRSIESRAEQGVPRDTHGDLHLDHIYYFPEQSPPRDLVIVDCIEFNDLFRYADPIADMAFLCMELSFLGRRDLARAFAEAYFQASGDFDGKALLPFYTAYRAAVRAKVDGLKASEAEVPEAERAIAIAKEKAHWLLALGELEEPIRRPCLLLVGGLPGTGKSRLAQGLAESAHFTLIRSDVVRKQMFGADYSTADQSLYSAPLKEQVYAACLQDTESHIMEGKRVLVDASFQQENWRVKFLEAARRWGVPAIFLCCEADSEIALARLAARKGDASDADDKVYHQLAKQWEIPGELTQRYMHVIETKAMPEQVLGEALNILRRHQLYRTDD